MYVYRNRLEIQLPQQETGKVDALFYSAYGCDLLVKLRMLFVDLIRKSKYNKKIY